MPSKRSSTPGLGSVGSGAGAPPPGVVVTKGGDTSHGASAGKQIGSEFSGEVMEVGAEVKAFKAGDRAVYLYGATNDKALPLRAGYFMH